MDANPFGTQIDQYRWQIADRVVFSESIDVTLEANFSGNNSAWTTVGLWYQLPNALPGLSPDFDSGLRACPESKF